MALASDAVAVIVKGYRELHIALAKADRDTRLGVRRELREVAKPVQQDAQILALARITHIPRSPQWARMRVGVTRKVTYVAPRQRGQRRGPLKRPNLAGLLLEQAMEPALQRNETETVRRFERMLDKVATDFNRGI